MKSYVGIPGDVSFFFRCYHCSMSFLIKDELIVHQKRCDAVKRIETFHQAMSMLRNIEY